ncbi:hypothetical protein MUN81_17475 [Hymenobacter sp. 5317J-9]|uniref:hypothetical protein n=1 Tax=Hymenobacter sp. 5317J-9 TaxID=2932250 RepID=UPI001FD69E9E|nr:hypothetical protein [Hymenobacter sp. 5317J-9]UOQ97018.1 hypothetical protein MUN81_17475 [Hymenobacter sp. 5317J-9]
MRPANQVLQDIQHFQPTEGNWLKLDDLITELWETGEPDRYIEQLFELLERFPTDESQGVLWGVLHGIEALNNYELELLKSIQRQPTEITTYMVHRIANTGATMTMGRSISELYRLIATHPLAPVAAKEIAESYL